MSDRVQPRSGRKPELGKWSLWLYFSKNREIAKYLPATEKFHRGSLLRFLKRYGSVYVKPSAGMMGRGILKVWQRGNYTYVQRTVEKAKAYTSPEAAARQIAAMTAGKLYIVQQGISLAKVNGRPFDVRVLVQRTAPGGPWLYTGMLAKIAGRGSVVTNVAMSRGRVMVVEEALRNSLGWSPSRIHTMVETMKRVSLRAAKHFDKYQFYREIGFDMAVDTSGRLWLIEENTGPSHALMKKLTSKPEVYRLMQRRWGQYQRARRQSARG